MEAFLICIQSLNQIKYYLDMMLADVSYDPHVSTLNHIEKLADLCKQALESNDVKELLSTTIIPEPSLFPSHVGKTVVSCDASIKNNPGGPSSCGVIFRFPDLSVEPHKVARVLPTAVTNNQAEYDSVYEALNYFKTFGSHSSSSIEIRTDSKLVCNQLNKVWEVNDSKLQHRHESITELWTELKQYLKIPITIVWYPRNSTDDLKQANYIAQDILGVSRH